MYGVPSFGRGNLDARHFDAYYIWSHVNSSLIDFSNDYLAIFSCIRLGLGNVLII